LGALPWKAGIIMKNYESVQLSEAQLEDLDTWRRDRGRVLTLGQEDMDLILGL